MYIFMYVFITIVSDLSHTPFAVVTLLLQAPVEAVTIWFVWYQLRLKKQLSMRHVI